MVKGLASKRGGNSAGTSRGDDIYETEITLEELMEYITDDLELPNLDKKKYSEILTESTGRKRGYQRYGIRPRLAKKKTVITKISRKQGQIRAMKEAGLDPEIERFPFKEERS